MITYSVIIKISELQVDLKRLLQLTAFGLVLMREASYAIEVEISQSEK